MQLLELKLKSKNLHTTFGLKVEVVEKCIVSKLLFRSGWVGGWLVG